jgi:hypothetical protein
VALRKGANGAAHLDALRDLSAQSGLLLATAGSVHRHIRSCKALLGSPTAPSFCKSSM